MTDYLVKKKSKIHGIGIFTTRKIEGGSKFYEVPLSCIFHEPKNKCAFIGNNKWVSGEEVLNYVNHSCNPNAILDISKEPFLIAKRNIERGEEITVDYNKTEFKGTEVPCDCKDKNCKKYFLRIE